MLLIRGHGQRKRFCRGPLRWPLQQAKGKPIGACSRLHTVTKESLGLCEAANEFGQRSSAAASLGSTSSSTRPPAQAAHCRAGLTVKVQSLSATQACSTSHPGSRFVPRCRASGLRVPLSRGGHTADRLIRQPAASPRRGGRHDKGGARWSACPGSLPRPPVLSEELLPG